MVGTSVSHYRLLERLGSGGMGEVWAAEDQLLCRRVAIKFPALRKDPGESRRRFEQEARTASQLTHPNIARVYDYGQAPDGRPFLVMELVAGIALKDLLRDGRLQPAQAGAITAGVLRALSEAHAHGLVHRDIKPANVMLSESGEVKVLDFGLARHTAVPVSAKVVVAGETSVDTLTVGLTAAGTLAGTPAYMSPEQARGETLDARSDLFSTGLLLYHCLTGTAPFSGSTLHDVLDRLLTTDPLPASSRVPGLPEAWDAVLARALQKEPGRRFQSAAEMLRAVEALAEDRGRSRSGMLGAIERHRHKVSAGALAGLLVLVSGVLLTSILAPRDPPPEALEWYRRGAMALRDGTYSAAANMLQKSVDLSPGFALAHARLAEAASELDDGARANREMLAALPKTSGKSPGGNASLYIDAIHLSLSGDLQGAAEAYRQLAANLAGVDKAAALVDLGRAYEKNRQVGKAVTAYREALSLDDQNAAAHLQYGILLGRRKDPEYAAELDRAFALYQALSNTEGQAEVLYQRGLLLSAVDPAAARAALERSREMARAIPSEQQDVAATLQLSTVAYVSGELERAEAMAAEGVERARRAGMNYLAARGLANLGDAQYLKRDYASAEASYNDSLTVARRHRLRRAEARALFGLANVHQTVGPEVAALDEARPALAYYREAGFQIETVLCLILLGRVNRDTGRPAEARTDFEAALVAARQVSDPARAHQAEQGMASVELAYGRWPDAIVKYELARHSAAEAPDPENVIRALNGMAGALWRLGRYQEAGDALQEAERELKRLGSRNSLEEAILHRRAEIALSRGRCGEAAVLARRVLASSSFGQSARCLAAAAETRLGRSAEVRVLCEEGLAALLRKGDQLAASEAQVWMSEILLQQEQHAAALDLLGKVATMAAATADRELEWRVWAMRAGVLRHLGDSEGAGLAARNAAQALARLEWDTKTLNGYLARPDIAPLKLQTYGGVR